MRMHTECAWTLTSRLRTIRTLSVTPTACSTCKTAESSSRESNLFLPLLAHFMCSRCVENESPHALNEDAYVLRVFYASFQRETFCVIGGLVLKRAADCRYLSYLMAVESHWPKFSNGVQSAIKKMGTPVYLRICRESFQTFMDAGTHCRFLVEVPAGTKNHDPPSLINRVPFHPVNPSCPPAKIPCKR